MKRSIIFFMGLTATLVIAPFLLSGSGSVQARWAGPHYTEWSALEPVTALNTTAVELPNSISHDGLRLYFMRAGDIYVSNRAKRGSDWGIPVRLPNTINTSAPEGNAFESTDGHWLYFGSQRAGGLGGSDIWVSWRTLNHDDLGWEQPVNLSAVNSFGFENGPMLFEDEETGATQLYFAAAPFPGGTQAVADIYMSVLGPGGFGPPTPVLELNWPGVHDGKPYLRRDGNEIFFVSYRLGTGGMSPPGTIFMSTRHSTYELWSPPVVAIAIPASGNPGDKWITTPVLSRDATTLFVGVNKAGSSTDDDIYVTYREKIKGPK